MTNENLMDALNGIDADMIEEAEQVKTGKFAILWIKWAAVAAAVALAFGIAWGTGILPVQNEQTNPLYSDPTKTATIISGDKLTGKQEFFYGEFGTSSSVTEDMIGPSFWIQSVLEVEVIEVLPDLYDSFIRIARLRVVDQIRGKGFPSEIFFQYYYFDEHIFDGYERFIISVEQIGIENYMMINGAERQVCYFSDMFSLSRCDLGYGSVIAFNNGQVDESFWDRIAQVEIKRVYPNHGADWFWNSAYKFPASRGSTLEEVKANILKQADDLDHWLVSSARYDYITADDVFTSKESRAVMEYVSPDSKNVFSQFISVASDQVKAQYTRVINGFETDEVIRINGGLVYKTEGYTAEDISKMPDIGQVLENIKPEELKPPHTEMEDGMKLRHIGGKGFYRKVDGKVYGIVRVCWQYDYDGIEKFISKDDCYFLYDAEGNGRCVEREELRQVIGDDSLIENFSYGKHVSIF